MIESTIAGGVFAGAKNPNQPIASTFLRPSSLKVGTSGSAVERVAPELASTRIFPARCSSVRSAMASMATGTWPPIRSLTYAADPLYATCTMSTPISRLNMTPKKCGRLPAPDVAYAALSGFALAPATNSGHVLAPLAGPAAIAN